LGHDLPGNILQELGHKRVMIGSWQKEKTLVKRVGPDEGGYWEVLVE